MDRIMIKKLILAGAVCAAMAAATGAVVSGNAEKGDTVPSPALTPEAKPSPSPSPSPTPSPAPWEIDIPPDQEMEDIFNILIIGTDARRSEYDDPGRGDATLLCSLNRKNGAVRLISFERSIGMPWPGHGDVMLTSLYAYGGAELMMSDISRCFEIPIHGYVHLDFEGFCRVIDAMGGLDIYLSAEEAQALCEDSYYERSFTEGMNRMEGADTLLYCRLRRIDDNWHRVARQRATVQAALQKAKSLSLSEMYAVAQLAMDSLDTSLNKWQVAQLLSAASAFLKAEPGHLTVPEQSRIWVYSGAESNVTGCDFAAESRRIKEFILAPPVTEEGLTEQTGAF